MAVKAEKDLSEEQRACWLKAVAAIEIRNFGYAISLLKGVLRQEPEFLQGRQLLRRAEFAKHNSGKKGFLSFSGVPMAVLKAQRQVKKDPKRAVEMVEDVLEQDPRNKQANVALKDAAVAAGWLETAVFALQTAVQESPRDSRLLHELARLYQQLGEDERELEVCSRILALDPTDAKAMRLAKDAAARSSMHSGGWAQAQSYRELIKDKEVAVSLEQQSRMQLGDESLERQITDTYQLHKAEPGSVDFVRRLGTLTEQKGDIEAAIGWYRHASELVHDTDPILVRKISDLRVRKADQEIAELEEFLASTSEELPIAAEKRALLEEAKKRRAEMLIQEAQRRVERNPTDLQFRFELGEQLMGGGRFRDAVPELQRSRQNPHVRLRAMNALGSCYRRLGMFDLAARQLEEAAGEIATMDSTKKEIVYNLGLVYEAMGEREKSLGCMKRIYEAEYGYKDVAVRVESSYTSATESQ